MPLEIRLELDKTYHMITILIKFFEITHIVAITTRRNGKITGFLQKTARIC